jgi:processive 1,2-diacylglycerol beta-glucosyltransferase
VIRLYDANTNADLGTLTEAQLQFLVTHLEEESRDDRDYYINRPTLEMLEQRGAEPELMATLRRALAERVEMDIRWQTV